LIALLKGTSCEAPFFRCWGLVKELQVWGPVWHFLTCFLWIDFIHQLSHFQLPKNDSVTFI
jgi:hypothetical protein